MFLDFAYESARAWPLRAVDERSKTRLPGANSCRSGRDPGDEGVGQMCRTLPSDPSRVPRMRDRECRTSAQAALVVLLAMGVILGAIVPAIAQEGFLQRDGGVTSAYPYGYSDGGQEYPGEEPGRWELPGPFSLLSPDPLVQ